VPIHWDELETIEHAHPFAMNDVDALLDRASQKTLAGWGFAQQALPEI